MWRALVETRSLLKKFLGMRLVPSLIYKILSIGHKKVLITKMDFHELFSWWTLLIKIKVFSECAFEIVIILKSKTKVTKRCPGHKLKMLPKLKSMNEKRIFSRKWIPHEDAIAVSGRKIENRIYRPKSTRAPKAQPHHDAMWNYWVGSFKQRVKRMVTSKADYTLRTPNSHLSVFGMVAKALTKMVRGIKNKTESQTLVNLLLMEISSTLP